MNDELYAFALRNTLTEIRSACPDVSHTFIFRDDGKFIIQDEETDEETATRAANTLEELHKGAEAIGGLESATFYGDNNRVSVLRINDLYLATIGSKEADEEYSSTLARILVPTVLRLTEKISNSSQEENFRIEKPDISEAIIPDAGEDSSIQEEEFTVVEAEPIDEPEPQPLLPDPPVTQFMVENLGGLLVGSDTVRIDNNVIQQWTDLYGDRIITEVDLETLNGKTTRCKFKPIKDSKQEGKGVIQLPQKIQQTLLTSKGELVMVKPAIE
jgi:hypothetical protein